MSTNTYLMHCGQNHSVFREIVWISQKVRENGSILKKMYLSIAHSLEITEIYSQNLLYENFVKTTILLMKLLN